MAVNIEMDLVFGEAGSSKMLITNLPDYMASHPRIP
jgi:hypothetical protein